MFGRDVSAAAVTETADVMTAHTAIGTTMMDGIGFRMSRLTRMIHKIRTTALRSRRKKRRDRSLVVHPVFRVVGRTRFALSADGS